jgi:hypothetical protein
MSRFSFQVIFLASSSDLRVAVSRTLKNLRKKAAPQMAMVWKKELEITA